ncbi:hypothetical protein FDP41_004633 [Naegleria fowleri]|uniref:Zn(2)-C6 fungal-type domain-containing protein n=1 Tax=Naegleria fowleri TaxID=5763 RepID=A0A6A5BHD9_NAEFO|nr:uncharacterized protein FDP41_004633 [Naegleria fowleri]KAF0976327.1 hypothetical protein FDP41_004633 [Naegleria fowleri]
MQTEASLPAKILEKRNRRPSQQQPTPEIIDKPHQPPLKSIDSLPTSSAVVVVKSHRDDDDGDDSTTSACSAKQQERQQLVLNHSSSSSPTPLPQQQPPPPFMEQGMNEAIPKKKKKNSSPETNQNDNGKKEFGGSGEKNNYFDGQGNVPLRNNQMTNPPCPPIMAKTTTTNTEKEFEPLLPRPIRTAASTPLTNNTTSSLPSIPITASNNNMMIHHGPYTAAIGGINNNNNNTGASFTPSPLSANSHAGFSQNAFPSQSSFSNANAISNVMNHSQDMSAENKKRRRNQAKSACEACRRAHTACQDQKPCHRCVKLGLECVEAQKKTKVKIAKTSGTSPSASMLPLSTIMTASTTMTSNGQYNLPQTLINCGASAHGSMTNTTTQASSDHQRHQTGGNQTSPPVKGVSRKKHAESAIGSVSSSSSSTTSSSSDGGGEQRGFDPVPVQFHASSHTIDVSIQPHHGGGHAFQESTSPLGGLVASNHQSQALTHTTGQPLATPAASMPNASQQSGHMMNSIPYHDSHHNYGSSSSTPHDSLSNYHPPNTPTTGGDSNNNVGEGSVHLSQLSPQFILQFQQHVKDGNIDKLRAACEQCFQLITMSVEEMKKTFAIPQLSRHQQQDFQWNLTRNGFLLSYLYGKFNVMNMMRDVLWTRHRKEYIDFLYKLISLEDDKALIRMFLQGVQLDLNTIENDNGVGLLSFCACFGRIEIFKMLCEEFSCSLYQCRNEKYLPIHFACSYGNVEIAEYILQKHPDQLDIQINNHSSPLLISAAYGSMKSVKFLVERGANVMLSDHDGQCAVYNATKYNHFSIVQYLAQHNADLYAKTNSGQSIFDLAEGSPEKKLLLELIIQNKTLNDRISLQDDLIRSMRQTCK